MKGLNIARPGEKLSVLCLGAHSDDIEIGLGGTLLELASAGVKLDVCWCVASTAGERAREAEASAKDFLAGAQCRRIELGNFDDTYFPAQTREIKQWLLAVRDTFSPEIIFTHFKGDAHQDHREICGVTWNVFRDNLILEYEIPKWDGDLGQPNFFVPLSAETMEKKIKLLERHFGTQRAKDWFDADTFRGLARLRGMECRAPERFAEAFTVRKAVMS